jgi:hypothetical protein
MTDGPRLLFIPVSGPGGAGEYFRSLAVARAIERRWPASSIRFLVSRDATYSQGGPYPAVLLERSPTFESAAVIRSLEQLRPHVVVFDSAGRVDQQQAAQRLGARVVFISSRPSIRRKGFSLRRMRATDQYWIAQPRFLGGELSAFEQWKLRFARELDVLLLEVIHEPVDEEGVRNLQRSLAVQPGGYVLACPGGGGDFGQGPDATQVFYSAAARVRAETALPVVAVLGARFAMPSTVPDGVHVLPGVPNGQLMGLLRDSKAAMVNGGSLLLQALAQHTPCVAAPIADDQPARIARTAQCGYVRPVALEACALASGVVDLLRDETARESLRSRLEQLALRNGLDVAVDAIGRLLPPESSRCGSELRAS